MSGFFKNLFSALAATGVVLAQSSKSPQVQLYAGLGAVLFGELGALTPTPTVPIVAAAASAVAASTHPLISGQPTT